MALPALPRGKVLLLEALLGCRLYCQITVAIQKKGTALSRGSLSFERLVSDLVGNRGTYPR